MQTTICAYCDHKVEITPDGVCLFCGGNLANEPIKDPQKWKVIKENIEKSKTEPLFYNLREIYEENKITHAKKEMKELDTFTKVIGESETVKTLVKSLGKPIIPFWFKFGAFLLGLIVGSFYAFPDIQIPLLETINLVNNSPYLILVMSFVPILFLIMMIQKFDRRIF